ncbi:hypothetical protein K439DRAFT_1610400 [Ramaria rubella]|nr:hypothetical protein K439DRAFT_1610400 [Ramaria rubella]
MKDNLQDLHVFSSDPVEYAVSTTTGVLCIHIKKFHSHEYIDTCHKFRWDVKIKSLVNRVASDSTDAPRLAFMAVQFKSAPVNWIVADDQVIVYIYKDIPHHTAIHSLVTWVWEIHFEEQVSELQRATGKISLNTDDWDNKTSNSCVTNGNGPLKLQLALIGSLLMLGRHFAQDLAKGLIYVTDRANITNKVKFITTDGMANMVAMMHNFEVIVQEHDIEFDGEEAHIITMLKSCTSKHALNDTLADFESLLAQPENPNLQSPAEALDYDLIAISHGIVNVIHSSHICCVELEEIMQTGNQWCRWTDKYGKAHKLSNVVLICDSPICWGSTYLMITRFLYLHQPVETFMALAIMNNTFKTRLTACERSVLSDI